MGNSYVQDQNQNQEINELEFIITRHAFSCNNLLERKGSLSNAYNVRGRSNELDPGLAMYGVITTLLKSLAVGEERYNSNTVFVSCLIRTWMTAILLYLPYQEELTLVISPYLKEQHKFFSTDGGNLPKDIVNQLVALIHFFNNLSILYFILKDDSDKYFGNQKTEQSKQLNQLYTIITLLKNKKIILKIDIGKGGNKNIIEIKITLNDFLNIDLDRLNNDNIEAFNSEISEFYYFKKSAFKKRNPPHYNLNLLSTLLDNLKKNSKEINSINKSMQHIEKSHSDLAKNIKNMKDYLYKIINGLPNNELPNNKIQKNKPVTHLVDKSEPIILEQYKDNGFPEETNSPFLNPEIEKEGGSSSDPFLEKNINKFIEWVYENRKNYTESLKIHAVTHSDCMQSFLSKIRLPNVKNNLDYDIFFGPIDFNNNLINKLKNSEIPLIKSDSWKRIEKSYNKASNKPILSPQNVWDLTFKSEFRESKKTVFSLKEVSGYSGISKPDKKILFNSCEQNCDFSKGIGFNGLKLEKCSKELNPPTGFFSGLFRRTEKNQNKPVENTTNKRFWVFGGKIRKTRKNKKRITKKARK